jgi:hypothetical protein
MHRRQTASGEREKPIMKRREGPRKSAGKPQEGNGLNAGNTIRNALQDASEKKL